MSWFLPVTTRVPLQSVSAIGIRPHVGFKPTRPEYEDGIRIDLVINCILLKYFYFKKSTSASFEKYCLPASVGSNSERYKAWGNASSCSTWTSTRVKHLIFFIKRQERLQNESCCSWKFTYRGQRHFLLCHDVWKGCNQCLFNVLHFTSSVYETVKTIL